MRGRRFRPRAFPLASSGDGRFLDAGALAARLEGRRRLVLLDSAGGSPARWHLAAFDPLEGSELAPGGGPAEIAALLASLAPGAGERPPGPFAGGFLGALAYDLGVAGERGLALPPDPWGLAPSVGALYVDFVAVELATGRAWLVLGEEPGDGRPALARRRDELLAALEAPAPPRRAVRALGPLARHVPPAEHARRVEAARAAIAAGDFYQANLAHRFTRAVDAAPLDLHRRLRAANPAPWAALLDARDDPRAPFALVSASPELLLELGEERLVGEAGVSSRRVARTRPIKGTAPRSQDPARDRALARALLASEKDLAELAMIVDLERNDLGRVARPGAVRVEAFPRLESYAGVHHLVADVVAEPRPELGPTEVLAALFPGGPISGAPKLASMAAIAALEGEGRGYFTGSLGFVDLRGRAAWSILIRTLIWRPGAARADAPCPAEVSLSVGGGITFSSAPELEERETLDKARALLAALEDEPSGAPLAGSAL
jgi:para-aminobenzoate synthetase component 1